MSDLTRRSFLGAGATAAAAAGLAAEARADIGAVNKPDPLLDGDELPTFRFALERSKGKEVGGNSAREATVTQLPISKGLAGVSMRLEPGGMRELHWHATAAEWALVLEGRVRTTVIAPQGYAETNDFEPGDVWYFPRGHGHMLQCLGNQPCRFILIFDNGYFSEFGTFSISDWIGHTPPRGQNTPPPWGTRRRPTRASRSFSPACQCNSRSAMGSRSRITPLTVFEIGNRLASTRHSRPPL